MRGDLEIESGHARHFASPCEQAHFPYVQVAQNLRADAVVAQIHFGVGGYLLTDRTLAQFAHRLSEPLPESVTVVD